MIKNFAALFFISCFFLSACNIVNPAEKVPTYIHVDSFNFINKNPTINGSSAHKITSVWVYLDNQTVGVYDIPANIPLLLDKPGVVTINPGVTYAGIKSFQVIYPFYQYDTITVQPAPATVKHWIPNTQYTSSSIFQYKEDFEVGNTFIVTNSGDSTQTNIARVTDKDKVFEGAASGLIDLTTSKPNSEIICNTDFMLGTNENYVELNYKCSTDFSVGLEMTDIYGNVIPAYIAGAKANGSWNKLYLGLETFLAQHPNGKTFRLLIKTTLPAGQSNAYVLLDNIKVVSN